MWPFETRATGRYPTEAAETAGESTSYTSLVLDSLLDRAAGRVDAGSLAVAEACIGLWERCLASATVEPMNNRTSGLTPQHMALVGRELATRGNALFKIEVKDGAVELVPASTLSVLGEAGPETWTYLTTTVGPSNSTTERIPSAGVVHFRIGASSWKPWQGVSPLGRGSGTASLGSALETSLLKEAKIPTGRLALAHGAGKVDGVLTWLKVGGHAVAGDTAARGLQTEPAQRHKPQYYGPEPEAVMEGLRTDVGRDILAAFGVSPVLFSERGDGTGQREAWRRFVYSTVAPLARTIAGELRAKVDPTAMVNITELRAADEDGRSRAVMRRAAAVQDAGGHRHGAGQSADACGTIMKYTIRLVFLAALLPASAWGQLALSDFVVPAGERMIMGYDGTWYYVDATETLSMAASDINDANVGGGFFELDIAGGTDAVAMAGKFWDLTNGDRFILAFTRPSLDTCNMYLGDTDLTSPSDLRVGSVTPVRVYLGSVLVCGGQP